MLVLGALLAAIVLIVIYHALIAVTLATAAVWFAVMALSIGLAFAFYHLAETGLYIWARYLRLRAGSRQSCPECARRAQEAENAAIDRANRTLAPEE